MPEHPSTTNKETQRDKVIKARATLDAFDYVALMRIKSPQNLKLERDGTLSINAKMDEGGPIFDRAREALHMDSNEMRVYILFLASAVKEVLLSKTQV
ncbi:hypothetical protein A3A95_02305 [Candidatus Nomurabacteria bacterium RIFCSPLOWO2_01_FULL_39_18]|uniref:Uncharacterized protein n=1 Tax=Candidatus Nomurabacteria bacterium RIFCSPHIGHO2_01_FULL_40_24b TaxID=1801739 RepID=A0A1F6V5S1_9BACT|nr:MAG: hypothetical protein A2647_02060 [Candidatus Nomurabacteria bacterium RIFCSPHIGHO2_01_FULL_40_24b]OGI90695.1 MAG: hypothetical protein A3A95_02305 [Candidatus Nomurabacteria bacterium RIFCSPLOWO2_01_FULL_39_18]